MFSVDFFLAHRYGEIMKIEFDPAKSERNAIERGLPFEMAQEFDWDTAIYSEDNRCVYPERRFVALGFVAERLHAICFTFLKNSIRVISFRKANKREVTRYEQETTDR